MASTSIRPRRPSCRPAATKRRMPGIRKTRTALSRPPRRTSNPVSRARSRPAPAAALDAQAPLQDPGSHQAPPDHPGAGGQERARQQGRGADDLSVSCRPLLRIDAQHPARGGISRKITNANDRKRLKSAAQALELPEGMASSSARRARAARRSRSSATTNTCCACGTAIRELTLKSNAPACVYEEGDLIKRAIRDLYNKDVGEILVEGDEGYRNARTSCGC